MLFYSIILSVIPQGVDFYIWVLSQVFALFALICIVIAFQSRSKDKTLLLTIIFNIFMTVSALLLKNYIIVGIVSIAVIRDASFLLREKHKPNDKILSYINLIVILIISFTVLIFVSTTLLDYLLMVSALFLIYGSWAKGVHLIRISRVTYNILAAINHLYVGNYISILIECFTTASIIIFYIRLFIKIKQTKIISENNQTSDSK